MIDGQPVSLLISSRNRPRQLEDAVRSALEGTSVPDEVVIVDQSDDPNEAVATLVPSRGVTLHYVKSDTVGISRSRNLAFASASHPVLVVLDDDCLVTPNWLETIVRALLAAGPGSVVTGRVLAGAPEHEGAFASSLHASTEAAEFRGRITTDPLATFNFALRHMKLSGHSIRGSVPVLGSRRLRTTTTATLDASVVASS